MNEIFEIIVIFFFGLIALFVVGAIIGAVLGALSDGIEAGAENWAGCLGFIIISCVVLAIIGAIFS